jgi:ABC-type transport system substrate-binding protein
VPEATVPPDEAKDWVGYLMSHPGYQERWGTPQYGGIIKTADPSVGSSWNITTGWSAFSKWQFQQNNSLLMMDPWLEIEQVGKCDLCESWSVSGDGKTYTFKLRQGVRFQSEGWGQTKGAPAKSYGAELTCEDVKASMEWYANPPATVTPSAANAMRNYLGHLDEVTCPDGPQGYTAVLNFTHFRNATLGWLAMGMPIWNKEYREWMDEAYPGIQSKGESEGYMINHGTGPWIPTFADGQSVMKVKKNPNYFKKGAPFADGFEFYAILEYNTKFASLLTGKVHQAGHGSSGLTKAQVIQVQRDYPDKVELHIVRYNHISHFLMNPMRPPFDNWKVRWAVNLALDRKSWDEFMTAGAVKMADPVFGLHSDTGWGVPIAEFQTFPGWRQDKKDEDIAEANRILDEVFGKGVRPRTDQYVIARISRRETSIWGLGFFPKYLNWEFDVKYVNEYGKISSDCLYTIRAEASPTIGPLLMSDPADAFWRLHSRWSTHELCRRTGWKGTGVTPAEEQAKLDALVEELDTSLDQARRRQLARELELYQINEQTIAAQLGVMNVAWANLIPLKGVHYYHLGTYSQHRLTDYLWLAK